MYQIKYKSRKAKILRERKKAIELLSTTQNPSREAMKTTS